MYNEIAKMILDRWSNDKVYFETPLIVKKTPHDSFTLYGVCVSPANQIYLLDGGGEWHLLKETDHNYGLVINSLYQRISILIKKAA